MAISITGVTRLSQVLQGDLTVGPGDLTVGPGDAAAIDLSLVQLLVPVLVYQGGGGSSVY
jgi:hypothetical protein